MSNFYITTPIYYVNDLPHVGHIYSTIVADTVARYRRLAGDRVYFLTGTDEHGQNIEKSAIRKGISPQQQADEVVAHYTVLWQQLDMTHDDFIRTTEKRHIPGVEEIVRRIAASGDLYVSKHEGWYCASCEAFYTEKELVDGESCPTHGRPTEKRSEENVFFRLSKYQDALLELYDNQPDFICPESRRNEVRQFVASGLKDLSVSRTNVSWALDFPGYEGHTVYVWLDALTNYISALGFGRPGEDALYDELWAGEGQRFHLVGKDILRFHAVYWPAFLLSAGLPLPTTVWAHGWWLRDQQKISKSVGNIVRPDELIRTFGHDPLRLYLLREMVFGQDATFSDESFIDRYNSDLANDLGNIVSRLTTLSRRAFDGHLPPRAGDDLRSLAEEVLAEYHEHMEAYAFHRALEALWRLLSETNQYLAVEQPWKLIKDPDAKERVSEILWCGFEAVRLVANALLPFLPNKAPEVLAALGQQPVARWQDLGWGGLPLGGELAALEPLFPRIDKKAYLGAAADEDKGKKPQEPKGKSGKKDGKKAETDEAPARKLSIDEFFEVDLRVARVLAAKPVPKSNKLLELTVDVGEEEPRTVVAGLAKKYPGEALVGKQVVVVANLKPAKLMGVESNGMVLAATGDSGPGVLSPEEAVAPGTRVR